MKILASLAGVVAFLLGGFCLVTYFPASLGQPPSYVAFSFHRSQNYYSKLALDCDELIAHVEGGHAGHYAVDQKDPRLLRLIRNLHATSIEVKSNQVSLHFEIWAPYAVSWENNDIDTNVWELAAFGDSARRTLFARTNAIRGLTR